MIPEDLIPSTPPAYGAETARVVLDIITQFPQNHDQNTFSSFAECGTVHCVAGWARHVQGAYEKGHELYGHDTEHVGAVALDLTGERDWFKLFYGTTDAQAVRALEYLAKGDLIDWDEVYKP